MFLCEQSFKTHFNFPIFKQITQIKTKLMRKKVYLFSHSEFLQYFQNFSLQLSRGNQGWWERSVGIPSFYLTCDAEEVPDQTIKQGTNEYF